MILHPDNCRQQNLLNFPQAALWQYRGGQFAGREAVVAAMPDKLTLGR
jgi:hypothetical protein